MGSGKSGLVVLENES